MTEEKIETKNLKIINAGNFRDTLLKGRYNLSRVLQNGNEIIWKSHVDFGIQNG